MTFGFSTYALGLLAGTLSTLSPCVLPLVPILVAAALAAHRWGAIALGVGLALSFAVVGIFVATVGAALGFDPDTFRFAGAVMLAVFGVILLVPFLQGAFARITAWMGSPGSSVLARVNGQGLAGQFLVGGLLGIVWAPCVGPTLGAATTLASQGRNLLQISILMLVFGIGAAAPLMLLGSVSRTRMIALRARLLNAGRYGRQLLGVIMFGLGVLIATGADKYFEAWILDRSPDWLIALTTRF